MTGTLLNVVAVLVGASIGLLFGQRLPEKLRHAVMQAIGLATIFIGLQMAFETRNIVVLLISLVLGAAVGAAADLEAHLERFAAFVAARLQLRRQADSGSPAGPGVGRLAEGFVTSSLVFCVGPMAIVGAIQDGLTGNFTTLAVKSLLDFFSSIAFAAALGAGVLLSAGTILVYQGTLTLLARLTGAVIAQPLVDELTAAGGLIILALGFRLLEVRRLPVANLLPALLVAPLLAATLLPLLESLGVE